MKNVLNIFLCFILASCASIPLSSMWQLRKLNIETLAPQEVEVALHVDEPFKFESAILQLQRNFSETGKTLKYHAELKDQGQINSKLPKETLFFKLNEQQAAELLSYRSELLSKKKEKGSLSVNIGFLGCFPKANTSTLTVSIYLKTNQKKKFIPLQKRQQYNNFSFPACDENN